MIGPRRGQLLQLRPRSILAEMSDAGLVAACATSDRTARTLLFERHVDAVHRFVSRMRCSDADAVEDLVQTTFLRAFDAAKRFRGEHARGWLFGIAVNVVREYARSEIRRKRAFSVVAEDAPRDVPARDPVLARLPDAVASLPYDLRAVLVLIDLEGERGADAAVALGIPESTLWRRLHDARAALRLALAGDNS